MDIKELELNKEVNALLEVAIDIAYSLGYDQEMADDRQDLIPSVIRWTFEFERKYAGHDWQDKGDYIDRIDEFIAEKVTEWRSGKR